MENTDGSALTNLESFRVYWGASPSDLNNSVTLGAGVMTYMVENLTPGTWFFAATAINGDDIESALSSVRVKTIL